MNKNLIPEEQRIDTAKQAKKNILKQIGKRIRTFRKALGYSQENLASDISKINIVLDVSGFSEKMISRYEKGISEMRIITFINICRGLRRTPNELLKDFLHDIEFERLEFLDLYEQLDDKHRTKAIDYLGYLFFEQNNGGISISK